MIRKIFLLLFAFATPALADVCYPESQIANVTPSGWSVEMPAPCEDFNNQTSYLYNPQTGCSTGNEASNSNSTETQSINYSKPWMPRYMGGAWTSKPNPPPGATVHVSGAPWGISGQVTCGLSYDTYGRRFAAMASYTAYDIGRSAAEPHGTPYHNGYWDPVNYYDPASTQQLVGMTQASFAANATTLCTGFDASSGWAYALNVIVWPDVRLVDLTIPKGGEEVDIEPHDGAAVADMNTLINWMVANIHQKRDLSGNPYNFKVRIYTNPFNGNAFFENGLDPDAECQVVDQCDVFTAVGNGSASDQMTAELALVPHVPHSHLYWLVDMQETPTEIADARAIAIAQGLSGVSFFAHGIAPCSAQWNAVLGAALGLAPPRERHVASRP